MLDAAGLGFFATFPGGAGAAKLPEFDGEGDASRFPAPLAAAPAADVGALNLEVGVGAGRRLAPTCLGIELIFPDQIVG